MIKVTMVIMMTFSTMVVRMMGDTTDPITTISTEAAGWVATNTTTITMVIRDLVRDLIGTTIIVETIMGQIVKELAIIIKWIVTMELEDTAVLVETLETTMLESITSV